MNDFDDMAAGGSLPYNFSVWCQVDYVVHDRKRSVWETIDNGCFKLMERCFLCVEIESPLGLDDAITIDHSTVITLEVLQSWLKRGKIYLPD